MMGRGRTHHHVTKQESEDQSRRPIIAMDYFFMRMESSPNAQEISEEPVTCIAVKEDRYQNIMSSVALKKGVEEPWTVERVAKFIDLLGYREITLKSDTELAIIAFRNRVAEVCKAEVTTEDAVKGDKESNGLIENAVMLMRGIIRTIKCHIESKTQEPLSDNSPVMPWLVEHAGCILSRCQKDRDGKTPFERLHGKKPTQEFVPFGEKVLARRVTTEPMNRMNPRYQYGIWLGMRNISAECFIGNAEGRRLEPRDRWEREAINNVIEVPWRMTDGRWTVDRPEIQVDPIPLPPLPFDGARVQRERITKQDIDEFGATIGCPGCNAIRDNKRRQAHSDRCRRRIEESLRKTPHGAERLERREEVIHEALAEEVRRREQRKKETDRVATAASGMTAESAPAGWRENPIEPDPNPKRRMLMKSTSLTASSSSGHSREKRTKSDEESRMQLESTSMPTTNERKHRIARDTGREHTTKNCWKVRTSSCHYAGGN